ncbi:DUF6264 family protein [Galbitalea soli]|uniref:Uncharacterized protein n=1 Tax=Galbitalea soli TaxID=1268042 RepID=A0A7C9PM73_9MICO|nr:DUF6264 family protein [Galbitalea soli]NEM90646.1 hypothetical protein [Galbitalea soli]NYJ31364.1 uncharacterized membrane protein YhaH (DUF805 family) [Galbitalea soli]
MSDPGEPDPRPRPQYGEYASPREQAAARGLPWPPATEPTTREASSPSAWGETLRQEPGSGMPGAGRPAGHPLPARTPLSSAGLFADRLVTGFLLALATINTVTGIGPLLSIGDAINPALRALKYPVLPHPEQLLGYGIALVVVSVVVYLATVLLAVRRTRRGRRAFWVPLLGFVVYFLATVAVMIVIVATDEQFAALLRSVPGGAG